MTAKASDLSFLQKLDIAPAVIQSLCQTVIGAIIYPFLQRAPRTFKRHILLTLMRKLFARISIGQLQYITGSTDTNYAAWARLQNLPYKSVELCYAETKAFWIGDDQAADTIIIYIHGGGWAMPANDAHFTLVSRLISCAKETEGKSVATLVLQYDLAPGKQYPHQLIQSVELLRYVVYDLGKRPGQIFLGGDSSGGNLILGIFSHLRHQHPSIEPLKLMEPLRGAFLASPVVKFGFTDERFRINEIFEPAGVATLKSWVSRYLGENKTDGWNQPLLNEEQWWKGLSDVVKEILITVASDEVMADDMRSLVLKIQTVYNGLTCFSSQQDFHAEPGIGYAVGLEECEAAKYAKAWVIARL